MQHPCGSCGFVLGAVTNTPHVDVLSRKTSDHGQQQTWYVDLGTKHHTCADLKAKTIPTHTGRQIDGMDSSRHATKPTTTATMQHATCPEPTAICSLLRDMRMPQPQPIGENGPQDNAPPLSTTHLHG